MKYFTFPKKIKNLFLFLSFLISFSSHAADVPSDLIIYGEDSVTLESEACVSGGSVVSGGDLTLGETSGIMGDAYVWETLTMADGSYITGDANVGLTATLDGTAVVEGTLTESVTDLPEVSIPTTTITTGSTRVKVKAGEMKILVVGNYSSVSVAPLGTLILRGGTYNIKELVLSKGSQIKIKGTSQIVVGTSLNWGAKKSVPDDITRRVSELTVILTGKSKSTISGYFKGVLYVPDGSVEVKNGGEVVGIVEAKSVTVDTGGLIRSASGATECSDTEAGGDDSDAADAGADDSGDSDAGAADAGAADAGADDSGDTSDDSGDVDAGVADAGADDSGDSDAGAVDAGAADAGVDDSGDVAAGDAGADAGAADSSTDSGDVDAGAADAGAVDAGVDDSGDAVAGVDDSGDATGTDGSGDVAGVDDSGGATDSSTEDGTTDGTMDSGAGDTGGSDGSGTSGGSDDGLPSDPSEVAPALDETVSSVVYTATEFIYTGDDPIQTGVSEGTIEPTHVAVIRGKVTVRDGDILSGVTISILNHDEFGSTQTRDDGIFDIVVNGGSYLTVVYKKDGYLPVHRKLDTPWQDYVWADDVAMVAYDSEVTTIDLSGATTIMQTAAGSESTDDDGTRTATILFPTGTTATMTFEDGSSSTLSTLNVRATEYTVGEDGFDAMPAVLPANSAYTYAVELSVDEAVSAEATEVTFNQPVYFYVENFLDFPVGETVPVGYYDKELSAWVPSDNGVIIEILGDTDGDGITEIDSGGDGLADSSATLTSLGFTDEERTTLSSTYTTGQTLWRVPVEHFSSWDLNWGFSPPDDAEAPDQDPNDDQDKDENDPDCKHGSIIECQNQTLGETIPLLGTPFTLNYRSSRLSGFLGANTLNIQVTGDTIPTNLKSVLLEVSIAGQIFETELTADANQSYQFVWDGLDGYGRKVYGVQNAKIRIGYVYAGVYQTTSRFGYSGNGVEITGSETRKEVVLWQTYYTILTSPLEELGSWSISPHHQYDVGGKTIYFGNGEKQSSAGIGNVIHTVAGTTSVGYSGDAGLATSAKLHYPRDVAVDNAGNLFIADENNEVIRKVDTAGIITTVAGTGSIGYSGDGGLATSAKLYYPYSVTVDAEGNLFISDTYNNVIRKVDTSGIITTVAGVKGGGVTGDGGLATSAKLTRPYGIAVDKEGNLFFTDNYSTIRKVDTAGIITTFAGVSGSRSYSGDGGAATSAHLYNPQNITVDDEGNLFIADTSNHVIRKVDTSGIITTVAGNGSRTYSGDGGLATDASLYNPHDIAVDKEGDLFIADYTNNVIRKVDTLGIITTIVGDRSYGYSGDEGFATGASMSYPFALTVDQEGNLFFCDEEHSVVRKTSSMFSGFNGSDIAIPSEDSTQLYQFNSVGQHQSTIDTITGKTLYAFGYDADNLLITITDIDGNITTIHRDADGNPVTIESPYGQTTNLTLDDNGYLSSVTNLAGEDYEMIYADEGGLLKSFATPRGYASTFEYDDLGRLEKDTNAEGASQTLTRESTDDGYKVTYTSAEYVNQTFLIETDASDEKTSTTTLPDGTQMTTVLGTDGSRELTYPDGTTIKVAIGPDPRFGMESPLQDLTITTLAGLSYEVTQDRSVTLSDADDLLSLTGLTETLTINGRIYTNVYEASLSQSTLTTPESRKVVGTFDTNGKVIEKQITGVEPMSYTYDTNGRLSTVTYGSTDPKTYTLTYYTTVGAYLQSITDPLSQVTSFEYDLAGRVTTLTQPDGRIISYTYDDDGNVTSVTPPGKPAHSFIYDSLDLGSSYTSPDLGLVSQTTEYFYNKDKQLDFITRPDGKTIDLGYDTAGRMDSLDADGEIYSATYSPTTGHLSSLSDPSGGKLAFTYDGGLLLSSTLTGDVTGVVSWTYSDDFWLSTEKVNGASSISFSYDDDGLMTLAGSLSLTRDANNGLITNTTLSSVTSALSYTVLGQIESEDFSYGGSSFYLTNYTSRDDLGRITEKQVTVGGSMETTSYTYDGAGWLETATNGVTSTTYTYDDNGNRLTKTKDGVTTSATYDDQDRLTTYDSNTYTYTDNGELLTKTNADGLSTYTYDILGNLKSVSLPDGTSIEYVIDASGSRVGKKVDGVLTQGFLYQNQFKPIAELDGSSTLVSRFIYGSRPNIPDYMVKSGTTYRIISDQIGSPRLVVNATTGSIVQQIDYDEFGNIISDTNPGFQPFGFAGGLYDKNTKLTRFGARDYDAEVGRWTVKDPIAFNGDGVNLYGYVTNDPINYMDPSGLLRLPDFIGVNIEFEVPGTGGWLAFSISGGLDRYGNWYGSPFYGGGGGYSLTPVAGSLTFNWLDGGDTPCDGKPTPGRLESFLTGDGYNLTAGAWGYAYSKTYSPGNGTATGIGWGTPQIGGSYNYSFKAPRSSGPEW